MLESITKLDLETDQRIMDLFISNTDLFKNKLEMCIYLLSRAGYRITNVNWEKNIIDSVEKYYFYGNDSVNKLTRYFEIFEGKDFFDYNSSDSQFSVQIISNVSKEVKYRVQKINGLSKNNYSLRVLANFSKINNMELTESTLNEIKNIELYLKLKDLKLNKIISKNKI